MSEGALVKLATAFALLLVGVIALGVIQIFRAYMRRRYGRYVSFPEAVVAVIMTCSICGLVIFSVWGLFDAISFVLGPRILAFFRSLL